MFFPSAFLADFGARYWACRSDGYFGLSFKPLIMRQSETLWKLTPLLDNASTRRRLTALSKFVILARGCRAKNPVLVRVS